MVDTNSDPNLVDFPIPANDDASNSIATIVDAIVDSIKEGLEERKVEKENTNQETEQKTEGENAKTESAGKPIAKKTTARKNKKEV